MLRRFSCSIIFDHYVAKMGFGVNWGQWTIFGPTDPTGPFIWHISQHTTTATSPIIVYNDQKKSKNSIKHEKNSKSKKFLLSLKKPSTLFTIIFLIWFRNPVPSLGLYFWSGLWVSCDRIIIGGCTRSNCFTRIMWRETLVRRLTNFKTHPDFGRIWTSIYRILPDLCWRERKSIYILYIDR